MSASMEAMQRAAALYHAGELHRAEELCRGVLGTHADHFDALSLLAVIVARTRRPEEAAGLLERALAARPAEPTTHNNYGNVLRELDRPGQALESYRRALRLMPDYADAHFNEANTLCHLQRLPEALEGYGRAVQIRPDYVGAHYNRALTLHALGRLPEALDSFDHVLRLKPDFALALSNRASVLYTLGRFAESAEDCARVLRIKADSAEAWYNHGNALRALGRLQAALESYGQALTLRPDYIEAHHNRGVLLHELERFDEALGSYAAALRLRPDYAAALYNQGVTLHGLKRFEEALESYEQALRIKPDYFEAHTNRGNTLLALKRYRLALDSYDRAINLRPDSAEIHFNRGVALHELGSVEEAHESYGRALALRSGYLEAHVGRGNASRELGRYDEALDGYSRALGLKADSAELHGSLGHVLHQLRRCAEALRHYDRALALRPDWAEGHGNRGAVLQALGRYAEALESYGRALELEPEAAPTHFNCGHVLAELERFDEALASYTRALELQPGQRWLLGVWLHVKMRFCDWNAVAQHLARLLDRIREGEPASLPFCLLGLSDSLELQRRAGEIWVRESAPAATLPPPRAYGAHAKIRLGYYSADFHSHATAYLAAQLFELHDRERFELVAFSFGPPLQDDPMRLRLAGAFDRFLDVRTMSDMEVARLSRELEIDIAVDLKGFTQHERSAIFAHRAAPVQVSYLGYPATMGAPWMDYLIADPTLIPESSRVHYAEKIVYLPHSYQVNDRTRAIAAREFSRLELGLPEVGFVYCCFNSSYKITPELFDSWMRILRNVQGSVLWLLEDSDRAAANLRREAEARGVAPARLVFAPRMSLPEHLARQTLADLFLDTSPCNAHTTASDALWAGLPLLTRSGESFAARVGASLLSAVGLPELITTTEAQYEALAIELARDPARLAVLRARLAGNRLSAPLFDTPRFTRHLESAYLQMHQRSHARLAPEHLFIRSSPPPRQSRGAAESAAVPALATAPDSAATQAQAISAAEKCYLARDWTRAEQLCRAILGVDSHHFAALSLLGMITAQTQRTSEAADLLHRAVGANPTDAAMHNNYGNVLKDLGRLSDALESYQHALRLRPQFPDAWYNRGNALRALRRLEDALDSYRHAVRLRPDYARAYVNLGVVLQDLGRYDEAADSYREAIRLGAALPEAHYNYGNTLQKLGLLDEALTSYEHALRLQPELYALYGSWLHLKMELCDWSGLSAQIDDLQVQIERGKPVSSPFFVLGVSDSPALQRRAAETWVREHTPPAAALPPLQPHGQHEKIRVGYYSADFRSHAVAYLAAELFELHDRGRFEVVAFSFGPARQDDPMRTRLEAAFDRFIDVRAMPDPEVARLSRELEIDIAVDLQGFTQHERYGIFAHRAAPLQVNYLGYPGTLGSDCIDYLIADRTLIPESSRVHYAEKIVCLPHSYQPNDRRRAIASRQFSREELRLPEKGFAYCCFNNAWKITPAVFDSWMRILDSVEGSVLWLLEDSKRAAANLRREAQARGVNPARLRFAPRVSPPVHLARQRAADLFLDTWPYNAHTTASDALWAGLPLLTRSGESFAARVGASLLNAVGLPELITTTEAQYEALAIELARDPTRLAALRAGLAESRAAAPLFDTPRFTRHLESAYLQIYRRSRQPLDPEDLFVAALPLNHPVPERYDSP